MRVIAGKYKNRKLDAPKGNDVRPTTDKIKGAIFNILNNLVDWEDCKILDICCGTGSLGIEALSRGAAHACFIDKDRQSIFTTHRNLENIKAENYKVICSDALKLRATGEKYSLIFMDPPYSLKLCKKILQHLQELEMLEDEFVAVLEVDAKTEQKIPNFCEVVDERVYGNTRVIICQSRQRF